MTQQTSYPNAPFTAPGSGFARPIPPGAFGIFNALKNGQSVYTLGLQPYPQKVVRPPNPPQPSFQEVVGALGIVKVLVAFLRS